MRRALVFVVSAKFVREDLAMGGFDKVKSPHAASIGSDAKPKFQPPVGVVSPRSSGEDSSAVHPGGAVEYDDAVSEVGSDFGMLSQDGKDNLRIGSDSGSDWDTFSVGEGQPLEHQQPLGNGDDLEELLGDSGMAPTQEAFDPPGRVVGSRVHIPWDPPNDEDTGDVGLNSGLTKEALTALGSGDRFQAWIHNQAVGHVAPSHKPGPAAANLAHSGYDDFFTGERHYPEGHPDDLAIERRFDFDDVVDDVESAASDISSDELGHPALMFLSVYQKENCELPSTEMVENEVLEDDMEERIFTEFYPNAQAFCEERSDTGASLADWVELSSPCGRIDGVEQPLSVDQSDACLAWLQKVGYDLGPLKMAEAAQAKEAILKAVFKNTVQRLLQALNSLDDKDEECTPRGDDAFVAAQDMTAFQDEDD